MHIRALLVLLVTVFAGCFVEDLHYVLPPRLTINVMGPGSVSSTDGAINCATGTCDAFFDQDTTVMLHAQAAANGVFVGFSGACSGAAADCRVKSQSLCECVTGEHRESAVVQAAAAAA